MVRVLGVLITIGLLWASPSAATPQSVDFSFSDEILGGENPGYVVNSSVNFSWDDAATCSPFCELTITLTAETTASGAAPSQGEVLGALVFDVLGGADFRDGPPGNVPWGGTVLASALEGSGATTAFGEIGLDVSAHWGLNPAIAVAGHGTHALSSVGDLFGGGEGGATMGAMHLFPGTLSSVELTAPNGSPFGIIDSASSSGGGGWPSGSLAYVQDEIVATLLYTGILSGIFDVEPLYGTDGLQLVPEPSTALLVGAGLLGLAVAGRRRKA